MTEARTPEQRFATLMRHARLDAGLRQEDVAESLTKYGITLHPSAISKMESADGDQRIIRLDEAVALASVLGLSIDGMVAIEADRVEALTWASRQFESVGINEVVAIGDAVLALAERYRSWLAAEAAGERPA